MRMVTYVSFFKCYLEMLLVKFWFVFWFSKTFAADENKIQVIKDFIQFFSESISVTFSLCEEKRNYKINLLKK